MEKYMQQIYHIHTVQKIHLALQQLSQLAVTPLSLTQSR